MATNAGFGDYRDYVFAAKCRLDYTPADGERLQDAIEGTAAPAIVRALDHRRERSKLVQLRPWDLAIDAWRPNPPLPQRYGHECQ